MPLEGLNWIVPGEKGYEEEAKCSGKTEAKTSGRMMKCTRKAKIWRVLTLTDGTVLPKAFCEVHRKDEKEKWEAIMSGTIFDELGEAMDSAREGKVQPMTLRSEKVSIEAAPATITSKRVMCDWCAEEAVGGNDESSWCADHQEEAVKWQEG